ncbi:DNA/RNA non-specific endonuclease [Geomonas propionica]|uniref:DNA/RNA non-specific endonuclease n=1 Tax=Geomonas propionica TaxID=2798582 RepID=A0ABS0YP51_9BACT|nr:DNA/RNA non-specific endonuclease [Geomonas propionica]MBJ6799729.1 DNA/RNA non-specific endonuclease [Geomonas propionica]
MKSFVAIVVGTFIAAQTWAADTACPEHFAAGRPPLVINAKLAAKTKELCNSGYGALHSGITKTPLYSAEHLTQERLVQGKGLRRQSEFHPDDRLPSSDRAELRDYARSGYDRGHVAPSGDMFDLTSQEESFSLANMIPQEPSVNRGVWERIESGVRRMARGRGELYIVTGPIFQGEKLQRIGGRVIVPTAVFKAIYDPGRQEAGAYIVDNEPGASAKVISVTELKGVTGLDVFPGVNPRIKDKAMRLPMPKPRKQR